jgi:uncharacterized protein YprB with RNaseH-like and TPR domain
MAAFEVPVELREVIRRIEARTRPGRPVARGRSLEDMLGGQVEHTERGGVLTVSRRVPVEHSHGRQPLAPAHAMGRAPLGLLARSGAEPPDPRRLLYLDTETTGLAGGTGTYAFLVGVGFFDGDHFEVRQYFMRDLDEEPALLAALADMLGRFDGLVTYNGTGFDLPLLETRFVLGRRRWRDDVFHLDLLPPARRLWSARLSDCRLGTVERAVLGFVREDDLPGALIPSAYFDYLRHKRPGEIPRVFEHNRHDILSLVALTGWVTAAVESAPDSDLGPWELAGVGRLWEPVEPERAEGCYRVAIERGVGSPLRERLLDRLAWREKRRTRYDDARALWERAARSQPIFDARPWEEVAKIDEHHRRDFATALAVVEEALGHGRARGAPERVLGALEHRLARLARRARRP